MLAADIDPFCEAAVALNAAGQRRRRAPSPTTTCWTRPPPAWAEVILAGDICYEKPLAERVLAWLAAAPGRAARRC